jgi:hypothetical protein
MVPYPQGGRTFKIMTSAAKQEQGQKEKEFRGPFISFNIVQKKKVSTLYNFTLPKI